MLPVTAPATWGAWVGAELDAIRAAGRWRRLRCTDGSGTRLTTDDGTEVVSFASNDYLGLSRHPATRQAAEEAVARWGAGAGASRLLAGDRPVHRELEERLASWRGTEAALVTATGYQANLAVMATFGAGSRIVSDELNHASIIDGARLARAEVAVFRHADSEHARRLVLSAPGRALVVTDTVFSMDGDVAPVAELSRLCAGSGALLVLDDAHAVLGVPEVDPGASCLRVGTLSKALGSQGGYVAGPRAYLDLLVNRARSFVFSTALSPAAAAAAGAAVDICASTEGEALRAALRWNVESLRPGHPSPILPVAMGEERAATDASARLLEAGLLVPAIRPPTVPPGTSRLRASLSAEHTAEDVGRLAAALEGIR